MDSADPPLQQQLGVGHEGTQGCRETHRTRATVAPVSILGPEWMMSPPVAES